MITSDKIRFLKETYSVDASDFIGEVHSNNISRETIIKLLNLYGIIRGGHFVLLSDLHTPHFLQFNLLAETVQFSNAIAKDFADIEVDVVITPDTSGIKLASGIADSLDADILINPVGDDSYPIESDSEEYDDLENKRVLLFVDIVTSGQGLSALKSIIEKYKGVPVGVAAFINRGYKSLAQISTDTSINDIRVICSGNFIHYKPDECDLCEAKQSEPIVLSKSINFAISSSDILELRNTQSIKKAEERVSPPPPA